MNKPKPDCRHFPITPYKISLIPFTDLETEEFSLGAWALFKAIFHLSLNFCYRMCAGGLVGPSIVKESLPPSRQWDYPRDGKLVCLMRLFDGGGGGGFLF